MDEHVIVVGGGIGGLCSGIYLSNKGFQVTIVEKNETLGGKINIINDKDFKFDLTASIVMTPKIYTDVFTDVDKNYKNYFTIMPLSPIYRVFYYDKTYCDFYSENNKMINELEKVFPGSSVEFIEFLSKSYKKYYLSKKKFLDRPMIDINEIINLSSIKSLMEIKPLSNTVSYLSRIINNEKIRNYLISKGIPTEIKAVDYFYYYLKDDSVNIYENPGLNNSIVATITKEDSFTPISVLTYRIDNQKWMKIKFNEKEGWIPESSFDYDTGI